MGGGRWAVAQHSLKGWHIIAQGNALGGQCIMMTKAEGLAPIRPVP
jgi:hypothetical protein